MSLLQVVAGGQYGSEAKGAVSAFLARTSSPLLAVRVAGPNAGHTVIGCCPPHCRRTGRDDGITGAADDHRTDEHPWRLRQIPVAAVTNPDAMLVLAPGSEIDPEVLLSEISALESAGYLVRWRLVVDQSATIIESRHQSIEQSPVGAVSVSEYQRYPRADESARKDLHVEMQPSLVDRIGSTGKGVGAARADRAMRRAKLARQVEALHEWTGDAARLIRSALITDGHAVLVEGTQGYALGQHAGFYPQCTSSDCTATDMLAMAGIAPWAASKLEVWIVFRSMPIRVAGDSGPLSGETSWETLGLPQERTTVTNKVRRVGQWDTQLARLALRANGVNYNDVATAALSVAVAGLPSTFTHRYRGPVRIAMMMADYLVPGLAGQTSFDRLPAEVQGKLRTELATWQYDLGLPVSLLGTGPATIMDLRDGNDRA